MGPGRGPFGSGIVEASPGETSGTFSPSIGVSPALGVTHSVCNGGKVG